MDFIFIDEALIKKSKKISSIELLRHLTMISILLQFQKKFFLYSL